MPETLCVVQMGSSEICTTLKGEGRGKGREGKGNILDTALYKYPLAKPKLYPA